MGIRRLRTAGRRGARRGGKKEGTPAVSLPLWTPTFPLLDSLAAIGERRPLRKGERQSGYRCVSFVKYSQFTDTLLLHMRFTLRRRDKQGRATRLHVITPSTYGF